MMLCDLKTYMCMCTKEKMDGIMGFHGTLHFPIQVIEYAPICLLSPHRERAGQRTPETMSDTQEFLSPCLFPTSTHSRPIIYC